MITMQIHRKFFPGVLDVVRLQHGFNRPHGIGYCTCNVYHLRIHIYLKSDPRALGLGLCRNLIQVCTQ